MNQGTSSSSPSSARRLARPLVLMLAGLGVSGLTKAERATPPISLHAPEIVELARSLSPDAGSNDSYPSISRIAFGVGTPVLLVAFEENQYFIYSVGAIPLSGGTPQTALAFTRRFIVLRPSIFIVDDQVRSPDPRAGVEWRLYSRAAPEVAGRTARVVDTGGELLCETLLPKNCSPRPSDQSTGAPGLEAHWVEETSQRDTSESRFLHVLTVRQRSQKDSEVHSEVTEKDGQVQLTVITRDRVIRLDLPPPDQGAGDISISRADGRPLLRNRLFPSGVLPHGPQGIRLMEQWDADYRGKSPPLWDIGRPSKDLKKVVEDGPIRPCRAVDLCCGTGTDAIYLASRGFDVTAIDVSPTALSQAQKKAREAGVTVRWLLADILAPASLEPFDFLYDRGCYHVVRDQNLAAYLETIRRLSHPGSRFLLLAARRDAQGAGPTGVTEEELGFDFFNLFDVEWLRESRLESTRPDVNPPAWSALLRRKPGT